MGTVLDPAEVDAFDRDGCLIRRGFFSAEQVGALADLLETDPAIRRRAYGLDDGTGRSTEISAWHEPGDDSFGAVARCTRMAGAARDLLGGPVRHYHSKVTLKPPGAGGTWLWHQDYGYWYKYGYLFPTMLSVAVPLTRMSQENGGLKVLRGSHRMGRVEHGFIGSQVGADPERTARAADLLETVWFEAEPGDVMWFHGNMLHSSANNDADYARNLFLVCYNRSDNPSYLEPPNAEIDEVPDDEILGRRGVRLGESRRFVDKETDSIMVEFERFGARP